MNLYYCQYSVDGQWVPFMIKSASIHEAKLWVKNNVQKTGVCVEIYAKITDIHFLKG